MSAEPIIAVEAQSRTVRLCRVHHVELSIVEDGPKLKSAKAGLWCDKGNHGPMEWDVVVQGKLKLVATNRGPAFGGICKPVPIMQSGWACECARCPHQWVSRCECVHVQMGKEPAEKQHGPECRTPVKCPNCQDPNWQRPKKVPVAWKK